MLLNALQCSLLAVLTIPFSACSLRHFQLHLRRHLRHVFVAAAGEVHDLGIVFSWFDNSQVPADFPGEKFVDLGVAWDSGAEISGRVAPPRIIAAFADEHTTLRRQMPD
jgi:hypothetical protein